MEDRYRETDSPVRGLSLRFRLDSLGEHTPKPRLLHISDILANGLVFDLYHALEMSYSSFYFPHPLATS